MTRLSDAKTALHKRADPEKAEFFPRFFKTGPGEYGEGDKFLGVTVPSTRIVAKEYSDLTLPEISELLQSEWHEERLLALIMLVARYARPLPSRTNSAVAIAAERAKIYKFYLVHTKFINNWDLVDLSCRDIVGWHIYDNPALQHKLDALAASEVLWERRIAMVSTMYFLMKGDPEPTLRIAETLLPDRHDLIQKAVGWMLRELGKRIDEKILIDFITEHYDTMGRTTLRYSIEKFKPGTRALMLKGIYE